MLFILHTCLISCWLKSTCSHLVSIEQKEKRMMRNSQARLFWHWVLSHLTVLTLSNVSPGCSDTEYCLTWLFWHWVLSHLTVLTLSIVSPDCSDTEYCLTWLFWHWVFSHLAVLTLSIVSPDTVCCLTWLFWHWVLSHLAVLALFDGPASDTEWRKFSLQALEAELRVLSPRTPCTHRDIHIVLED
jgi:hypothetical protein